MTETKKSAIKAVQFIGTSPDEVNEPILNVIKEGFKNLQQHFQPKQPPEYLTRNEVKEMLKVDLSTVHNWTKKGKLKAYGIGQRVYYRREEVEQAIKPLNF